MLSVLKLSLWSSIKHKTKCVHTATTSKTTGVLDATTDSVPIVTETFQEQLRATDNTVMETYEVQEIADINQVDVRIIEKWHWRLIDVWGNWVIDIYFKRDKMGRVERNTVKYWKGERWGQIFTKKELEAILKKTPKWKSHTLKK